jgi:hypothetical protein
MLPVLLLIFAPSFCHQPWTRICFGSGRPIALSMIGQKTA